MNTALRWGIKRSFVGYVSRLPDGSVSAGEGASIVSGSYFQFEHDGGASGVPDDPAVPGGAEQGSEAGGEAVPAGVLKFRGQVRLSGHHGMMSLFVADPWIEVTADGGALSVVDPQHAPGSGRRVQLLRLAVPRGSGAAGLDWSDGTKWTELPAQLAPDAVELFNGQYPAGEEMDPVFLGPAVPGE